eukprot:TRINITY_DN4459_c0_g1_i4.p1 TRINITY_DN4459_c0_g1~~TRINITY_DN4459_c0_g1_i4.p1  ORF type:complete len:316 (+),score=52.07 TRINITY_DN4459_c0_g1_i4:31-948(+)
MGQGTSDASSFKGLGEGGDDGFARAACGSKQDGQLESNPVHQKVTELHGLFRQLEDALANPKVAAVGDTYRKLAAWNKDHRWDPDLQSVLEVLSQEHMCPMWRRQALEEAYRLFYDDVAIRGLEEELAQLPEPPTSEDIGFRQLPEALLSSAAARQPVYRGSFEDQNACMVYRRRWDYEIRKTGEVGQPTVQGRSISFTGHSRYMCAGDVATKVAQAVLPVESCCAARETANRARGPFFLPHGGRAEPLRPPTAQDLRVGSASTVASNPAGPKQRETLEPLKWDDGMEVPQRARLVRFPPPRREG